MPRERCVHIVDDDAKVRDALTLLLSTAQIKTRCYASAEEYLASNKLQEPACVLLDSQLPGMSGLELLKHIVAAASDPAVIIITAYGDVPTAVLAMKAGAFDFVQKPFDAEALLGAIEEALSRADEARDVPTGNRGIQGSARTADAARARGPRPALGGVADEANRSNHLQISARTVEHHRAAIMQKMQARNISHLLRMTLSLGNSMVPREREVGGFTYSSTTTGSMCFR